MARSKQSTAGRTIVGVLLILLGIVFLITQFFEIDIIGLLWPLFIIVPGAVAYIVSLTLPEEPGKGVNALGSIITMVGLLLLYQNTTGHFESWAYAWALVAPTSIGVGWMGYGLVKGNSDLMKEGTRIAGTGLGMFLIGLIFFELILGISGFRQAWAADLWPLLLIIIGLILLARNIWSSARP